ncbi:hypothetical protein QBC44DRAFT_50090 [Cladorrhinum sp. PSN332]|nr:hypothetical protein QBC44DRAFT_50090 [Cladorrhinum sp. PSN332]
MPGQPHAVSGHRPRSSLSSTMRSSITSPRVHLTQNGHDHEAPTSPSPASRSPRNLSHEQLPRQVRFTTATGTHVAHGRVQKSRRRDHDARHESAAVTAATQFLRRTITPIPDTQPPDDDDESTQPSTPARSHHHQHHRHHHHSRRRRIPAPVTISPEPEEHPVQVIKPSTPRTPLADITPPSSAASASMMMAQTQSTVAFDTEFERVEYIQQNSPRPRSSVPSLGDSVNLLTAEEARRLLLLYAESTPSLAGLIQEIAYTRVSRHGTGRRERRNSSRVIGDGS